MLLRYISSTAFIALLCHTNCFAEEGYATPSFSHFTYNNVHDINSATMSLPAPVGPFRISCVAEGPVHPYRLMIIIDTLNASYKEIDESDERSSPDVWEGTINSTEIRVYFPERDGRPVKSYSISQIPINEGLIRLGTSYGTTRWGYWRKRVHYECVSRSNDGELLPELISKMIEAESANRRH